MYLPFCVNVLVSTFQKLNDLFVKIDGKFSSRAHFKYNFMLGTMPLKFLVSLKLLVSVL